MAASLPAPHRSRAAGDARGSKVESLLRRVPVLRGILPITASRVPADVLAGITLAALGIPEVLGYAKIAGMPVVTGLYTIVLPIALFAVLGSSRHLVVGADSATAAILAAGLGGAAKAESPHYVALAGLAALVCGALLLLARVVRLGFVANFLSRTVLVGFLTGVGIQVAIGQVPEMLGVPATGHGTVEHVIGVARAAPHLSVPTLLVSAAVIVLTLATKAITRKIPGALLAVVAAIVVSRLANLPAHGVSVVGSVPKGMPSFALPAHSLADLRTVLAPALSMFVVILAQSSATSRAYAARYDESFDEGLDLVALGAANAGAAFTGTFVVNGSPTKTQMVDGAGGKSQLAQLTTAAAVVLVLLFLTGPLSSLPVAVLATIVFLIGVELIDVRGLRQILRVRRYELVVALLTAAAVVFLGVQQGIFIAVAASIVDHLRHSYSPRNFVLVETAEGLHQDVYSPALRTRPGLAIYRFGSSLYYANAHRLHDDVMALTREGPKLEWIALDAAAIGDVDFTAAAVLRRLRQTLAEHHVRLVLTHVSDPLRDELQRYGLLADIGSEQVFPHPPDVLRAFERRVARS